MPLRAALVGLTEIGAGREAGRFGSSSLVPVPTSHAGAYEATGLAEIVAVCDRDAGLLDRFARTWGDVWPAARPYVDAARMLEQEQLDLLSIVTSDHTHAEIAIAAVNAGVRGIFCEKPLATTLDDADRMARAFESAGTTVVVNHTRRWWPLYHQARELIRDGRIGEVSRVYGSWGGDRAMLFRTGTHLIDTVCFLVEADPEWVVAALDEGFESYETYRGDGGRDPASEPGCSAIIGFRGGARAFIDHSKGTVADFSVTVTGNSGRIVVKDESLHLYHGDPPCGRLVRERATRFRGTAAALVELVEIMESGREPTAGPRTAMTALQIIYAILESQRRGVQRVSLPLSPGP